MWWRRYSAAAILPMILVGFLTGESSEALTTFGKSATQPPYQTPSPTGPPARACTRQSECAGIVGSSCVRTPEYPSKRCLCGDNKPATNGQCETTTKGLYHACTDHNECADAMICTNTTTAPPTSNNNYNNNNNNGGGQFRGSWNNNNNQHQQSRDQNEKFCQCDIENGYIESDFSCSDGATVHIKKLHLLMYITIAVIYRI